MRLWRQAAFCAFVAGAFAAGAAALVNDTHRRYEATAKLVPVPGLFTPAPTPGGHSDAASTSPGLHAERLGAMGEFAFAQQSVDSPLGPVKVEAGGALEPDDILVVADGRSGPASAATANQFAAAALAYRSQSVYSRLSASRATNRLLLQVAPQVQQPAAIQTDSQALAFLRTLTGAGAFAEPARIPAHAVSPRVGRDIRAAAVLGVALALSLLAARSHLAVRRRSRRA